MLNLSTAQLAKVQQLTDKLYPHLHPRVRLYCNEQLLTARQWWEYDEWVERMELTLKFYEEKDRPSSGNGGIVRTKRKKSLPRG